jgi:hypothetical protein
VRRDLVAAVPAYGIDRAGERARWAAAVATPPGDSGG